MWEGWRLLRLSLKGSLLIRCVHNMGFSGEGARCLGLLPQPPCWCPNQCWGWGDTFGVGGLAQGKPPDPDGWVCMLQDLTIWCHCRSTHLNIFSLINRASNVTEVVGYVPLPGRIPEKSCVLSHVGSRQREMKCSPRISAHRHHPCQRQWAMPPWGIQAPPGPKEPGRSVWGCWGRAGSGRGFLGACLGLSRPEPASSCVITGSQITDLPPKLAASLESSALRHLGAADRLLSSGELSLVCVCALCLSVCLSSGAGCLLLCAACLWLCGVAGRWWWWSGQK